MAKKIKAEESKNADKTLKSVSSATENMSALIDDIIKKALQEDINYIDTSADLVIDESDTTTAYFQAKADGVLCGLDVALRVFQLLDKDFRFTSQILNYGDTAKKEMEKKLKMVNRPLSFDFYSEDNNEYSLLEQIEQLKSEAED